jgi:hypothetical protein
MIHTFYVRMTYDSRSHKCRTVHFADSPGYAAKKEKYPEFFKQPRNLKLGFCADGVAPFEIERGISFECLVLSVWNLPPDIRYKRENMILFGLSDKKPPNSQLIFELLVDELEELWTTGVPCWDSSRDQQFCLKAMLMTLLMDYPGLTDAMCVNNEGTFAACAKCSLQGLTIKSLGGICGDVKYSARGHNLGYKQGKHDIELKIYTHDDLVLKAVEIEVRSLR